MPKFAVLSVEGSPDMSLETYPLLLVGLFSEVNILDLNTVRSNLFKGRATGNLMERNFFAKALEALSTLVNLEGSLLVIDLNS